MEFEAAYKEHYAAIYRYCYRLLGSGEMARDLTQETFMRLLVTSRQGQDPENPAAWLYRVASNLCLSHLSQTRRHTNLLQTKTANSQNVGEPDRQYERQELIGRIRAAIAQLSPRDQVMLNLYQDKRSYDEIAEIIGVRRSSVGTLLSRALGQLRRPEITGVKP